MTAVFLPGAELARRFYHEVVRPLVDECLPDVPHSAALLGPGSEVLGYDTERSTDHDWGPRVLVFLGADDTEPRCQRLDELLAQRLPETFGGYPTRYAVTADAAGLARHRQEEAFVGRCGEVGDELGSAVVAARLSAT